MELDKDKQSYKEQVSKDKLPSKVDESRAQELGNGVSHKSSLSRKNSKIDLVDPRTSTISLVGTTLDKYSKGAYLEGYIYAAGSTPSTIGSSKPTLSDSSPPQGSTPTTSSSPPIGSRPQTQGSSIPRGSTPLSPSVFNQLQSRLPSNSQSPPSFSPSAGSPPSGSSSTGWTPRGSSSTTAQLTPSQLTERRASSSGATGTSENRSQTSRQAPEDGSRPMSDVPTPPSSRPKTPIQWPWRTRKPRWRRGFTGIPPSSYHLDIDAPNLHLVEQSMRTFTPDYFSRAIAKVIIQKKASDYHDESGSMLLWGSAGGRYLGDVVGGLPHGHGQHWVPDSMSRKGALRLLYDGQWEYGMKTGYGCLYHTNGQEYRGEMKNGEHFGHGCMKYKDGSIYEGKWWRGRKHGIGTYYYINDGCYMGAWKKDQRDGWGIYCWPLKRRKWEGEWVNDFPYSGAMSPLEDAEYKMFNMANIPDEFSKTFWNRFTDNVLPREPLGTKLPIKPLTIKRINLRHPSLSIYSKIAPMRKLRDKDKKDGKLFQKEFQNKLRGSMPYEHLEAMKHSFHKLAPGYMHRTILHGAQIRRLVNVGRIDPDTNEGQKLTLHLQNVAKKNNNGISFNNLLHSILSYHDP